jgi:glycosyltransferase involved in cell wall biosynthesis
VKNVFFVGPLPPPVHGFSWVNSQVYSLIEKKCTVIHFDRTPSLKGFLQNFFKIIAGLFIFLFKLLILRPSMVYIGWSGGVSMLIDGAYVFLCRIFFIPVCIHHHSFAYLNNIRWFNKIALILTRNQVHVVLCQSMANLLIDKYNINKHNLYVVSNAAFLDFAFRKNYILQNRMAVGFLSNVTEAKGIFEFFDLARHFSRDKRFHFYIAGPVEKEILNRFNKVMQDSVNVNYVGPVYSKDKDSFLNSLDVFVFPTKYVNEAEPVTISEAMRAGLPVISIQRGCIASMLDKTGVVTQSEKFIEDSDIYLNKMISDSEFYTSERTKAAERFELLRAGSIKSLETLIDHLTEQKE